MLKAALYLLKRCAQAINSESSSTQGGICESICPVDDFDTLNVDILEDIDDKNFTAVKTD